MVNRGCFILRKVSFYVAHSEEDENKWSEDTMRYRAREENSDGARVLKASRDSFELF